MLYVGTDTTRGANGVWCDLTVGWLRSDNARAETGFIGTRHFLRRRDVILESQCGPLTVDEATGVLRYKLDYFPVLHARSSVCDSIDNTRIVHKLTLSSGGNG